MYFPVLCVAGLEERGGEGGERGEGGSSSTVLATVNVIFDVRKRGSGV